MKFMMKRGLFMSTNDTNAEVSYEALCQRAKKIRKRVLIVLLCCVLAIALLIGGVLLLNALKADAPSNDYGEYEFYDPYEGDIMQNQAYLSLNREFCYCADATGMGMTYPLNEDELAKLDPSVRFVCNYLQAVIDGDAAAYNAMFSADYLKKNGSKSAFNPQMLYNITIYRYQIQNNADGSKTLTYKLDYMIYRNDGTFRRDIGSDAIRSQYLVLDCAADGSITVRDLVSFRVGSYVGQEI